MEDAGGCFFADGNPKEGFAKVFGFLPPMAKEGLEAGPDDGPLKEGAGLA